MGTINLVDLSPFCGRKTKRLDLQAPLTVGKWRYATDGAIAVRVPAVRSVETKRKGMPKDISATFRDFDSAACETPWPHYRRKKGWLLEAKQVGSLLIKHRYWSAVYKLGRVRYHIVGDRIHFVCGDLQGIVCSLVGEEK